MPCGNLRVVGQGGTPDALSMFASRPSQTDARRSPVSRENVGFDQALVAIESEVRALLLCNGLIPENAGGTLGILQRRPAHRDLTENRRLLQLQPLTILTDLFEGLRLGIDVLSQLGEPVLGSTAKRTVASASLVLGCSFVTTGTASPVRMTFPVSGSLISRRTGHRPAQP